jgi:hypothetical protein
LLLFIVLISFGRLLNSWDEISWKVPFSWGL